MGGGEFRIQLCSSSLELSVQAQVADELAVVDVQGNRMLAGDQGVALAAVAALMTDGALGAFAARAGAGADGSVGEAHGCLPEAIKAARKRLQTG
ncbi:MAG: hypothetical protein JWP44_4383, partial [Mucilaginibacter sp.]|nr:hypothetical protein [Mucilaginibacter sp.]